MVAICLVVIYKLSVNPNRDGQGPQIPRRERVQETTELYPGEPVRFDDGTPII